MELAFCSYVIMTGHSNCKMILFLFKIISPKGRFSRIILRVDVPHTPIFSFSTQSKFFFFWKKKKFSFFFITQSKLWLRFIASGLCLILNKLYTVSSTQILSSSYPQFFNSKLILQTDLLNSSTQFHGTLLLPLQSS